MWKFLIFFFLVAEISAQTLDCYFSNITIEGPKVYGCRLIADNPNGFDNITVIGGDHEVNKNDDDVLNLLRDSGTTAIIPSIICQKFRFLRQIYLRNFGLKLLNENSISACNDLEFIDLENNNIEKISSSTFTGLQKLITISLYNNQILSLSTGTFANLESVTEIYINANPLITIETETFNNLPKLDKLNLYGTNLSNLPTKALKNIPNLSRCQFGSSNLTSIADDAFFDVDIYELSLTRNLLTKVGQWFNSNSKVQVLRLGENSLTEIAENAFSPLRTLIYLDLQFSNLTIINSNSFPSTMPYFVSIYANDNFIQSIDRKLFDSALLLKYVYFGNNICINNNFTNFVDDRDYYLRSFHTCFDNFDTAHPTEPGCSDENVSNRVCELEDSVEELRGKNEKILEENAEIREEVEKMKVLIDEILANPCSCK